MRITLYHISPSFFSQIARLTLVEKGADFEPRVVDIGPRMENYEPWYARINPEMVVPALVAVDDAGSEQVVVETAKIIAWIDAELDGPQLLPNPGSVEGIAVATWLARIFAFPFREFSYGAIQGPLGNAARSAVPTRIDRLRAHQAENPDLRAVYQARIDDVGRWRDALANPETLAAIERDFQALLGELEAALEAQRERGSAFLVGERYTLADTLLTVAVARFILLGRRGQLGAATLEWFAAMKARPSFEKAAIWDRRRLGEMLPILLPLLAPKLAIAGAGLIALLLVLRWLLGA